MLLSNSSIASSRLSSRRFSLPSPWIWFGNPEPLCCVSPQALVMSGSGSITRCYDTRTYNIHCLYDRRGKKICLCHGNSSRFFRRSHCKFNGRHAGATATSYLDMYCRGKMLGDPWVLVESCPPGRVLLPESGLCSSDGAIHNQQSICLSLFVAAPDASIVARYS